MMLDIFIDPEPDTLVITLDLMNNWQGWALNQVNLHPAPLLPPNSPPCSCLDTKQPVATIKVWLSSNKEVSVLWLWVWTMGSVPWHWTNTQYYPFSEQYKYCLDLITSKFSKQSLNVTCSFGHRLTLSGQKQIMEERGNLGKGGGARKTLLRIFKTIFWPRP